MALVPTADLVKQARLDGRSIAAFNVITLEHAEGIALGAERAGLPVIMQLSQNAVKYHGSPYAIAAACTAVARQSSAHLSLHLDHITELGLVELAPALGASSVMYDGAHLPYEENVGNTAWAARWGREHGIWVEAELGEIGGKDGAHAPGVRTDPAEALQFVADTGVQALAVAVGSSHAMTAKEAALDHALIAELNDTLDVPLVLHGSSGVPDDELRRAAKEGMVKINIGTALNIAYTGATRAYLAENPAAVDPRKYMAPAREAVAEAVAAALRVVAGLPASD